MLCQQCLVVQTRHLLGLGEHPDESWPSIAVVLCDVQNRSSRPSMREREAPLRAHIPPVTIQHTTRNKQTTNSLPSAIHIHSSDLTPRLHNLQTSQLTQNPRDSSDPLGQGILTRTFRPSLTLCRTMEFPRKPSSLHSPHDPATLGTGSHSDCMKFPTEDV